MSEISKQALAVENTQSFPNNNTGYITPSLLRSFNQNVIDSTVNQTVYTADSSSWNSKISQLNAFTASQQPTFTALNAFTASQLVINGGVNSFTQSANGRLAALESETANLEAFTSSVNQIIVNGASIGTSTRLFFNGFVSASIVPNVDGAIASITVLSDTTNASSASFNAYTASTNAFTASAQTSINQLLSFSSSLDATYATDAQLNYSTSVLFLAIDTKVGTASFNDYTQSVSTEFSASSNSFNQFSASQSTFNINANAYTASNNTKWNTIGLLTGSFATTGSNTFIGNEIITGSLVITGSASGNVVSASIVSNTASIDLSKGDFYTLKLPNGIMTNINITNAKPGTTALIEITNTGIASASFSSNVKQSQYSNYIPTSGSNTLDLLSISAFNASTIYVTKATNFI